MAVVESHGPFGSAGLDLYGPIGYYQLERKFPPHLRAPIHGERRSDHEFSRF